MVLQQKTDPRERAPKRCCHATTPTASASPSTTTAWSTMLGCSFRPRRPLLGLRELVDRHLDLGDAPGRANAGDKMLTLVASALAGGDCIDDADALRAGRTSSVLGCMVKAPSTPRFREGRLWGRSCAAFAGPRPPTGPGEPRVAGPRLAGRSRTRRRTLIARVPGRPDRNHFPKEDFHIDLEVGSCTCPPGNVTRRIVSFGTRTGPTGRTHRLKGFRFDGAVCG